VQDPARNLTQAPDDPPRPLEVPELLAAMSEDERAEVEHDPAHRYDPDTGEDLSPAIDRLQHALTDLGVPGHLVARVVRRGRERPSYELVLKPDDQVAALGRASKVLHPREVQARLLDATGHAMRVPKLDDWRPVAELIVRAAEHDDEPDADWRWRLRQYLADSTMDRDEAAKRSEPFLDDAGCPYVHRERFGLFLRRHHALAVTAEDVREGLRGLGFESIEVWWTRDNGRRARTLYWRGPADWDR
jgi:hypothetical protein